MSNTFTWYANYDSTANNKNKGRVGILVEDTNKKWKFGI